MAGKRTNYATNETIRIIEEKIVKRHLDIIVLKILKKRACSGYAIILFAHREYGVLLGAGMVYNLLRSLERRGLIRSNLFGQVKLYLLDCKGEDILEAITRNQNRIRNRINQIFSLEKY